ncbi:MAG: NAD-dependent epimerase/dehydratase family protein [Bacteroidetes bacterium]|nr:NAD-dependent epimerase/dehydratase family protein [Bacteroidota bacterium]
MILVSGATGFVGSYIVCELLRQDKKVRALKRASSNLSEFEFICRVNAITATQLKNLEWCVADILEFGDLEVAFQGVTEVVHCAGFVSFVPRDQVSMARVNIEGTANMVNLALQNGVKKFGYLSSIAAIGRASNMNFIDENIKWEASVMNTHYAETKFEAEMEVWRGVQEGLNAVIVNPGVIIGACDFTRGTGKMFETMKKGLSFYTPGVNGFVDVRDVSKCLIQLMDSNIYNDRFILVSENYEFKKFYEEVAESLNKSKPRYNTPFWLGVIVYRLLAISSFFKGKAPLLTRETTLAAYRKFYYNNLKIKNTLGIEFITVKETIQWTCGWYK